MPNAVQARSATSGKEGLAAKRREGFGTGRYLVAGCIGSGKFLEIGHKLRKSETSKDLGHARKRLEKEMGRSHSRGRK